VGAEPQLTLPPSRWTDRHQKLAEELASWIVDADLRTATIHQVWEYFRNEKKRIGDLERWLRRAIQGAFFWKQIWGKEWSSQHQQFAEACTTWITDRDIRNQVASRIRPELEKRKTPPKNPSYWVRRIINDDFREECKRRSIPTANQWTDETWELARKLAAKQGIPKDMRDSVISQVWRKFVGAVEPIAILENWMNNVIRSEYNTEITDMQGEGPVQWQILTQVPGTKQQVDNELGAPNKKEYWRAHVLEDQDEHVEETGPSSPMPAPDNHMFLEKLFQVHEEKSGLLGKLSTVVIYLCSDEVGYTSSELGEHLQTSSEEIENFIDHDYGELTLIAKEEFGMTGWTL
jgi:hypothetical protein